MAVEISESVRKVQKFSRYARGFCIFFFITLGLVFLLGASTVLFGAGMPGAKISFGPYAITGDHFLTPAAKAWGIIVLVAIFAILFAGLFHLHRLFRNFIAGCIYTRDNVNHIRQLGILSLEMALLQLVMPIISTVLLESGVIDPSLVTPAPSGTAYLFGAGVLPGFVTGSIILLASWIMDLGRQTRDEADELRRDAELIV